MTKTTIGVTSSITTTASRTKSAKPAKPASCAAPRDDSLVSIRIDVAQRIVPRVSIKVDIASQAQRLSLVVSTDTRIVVSRAVVVEIGFPVETNQVFVAGAFGKLVVGVTGDRIVIVGCNIGSLDSPHGCSIMGVGRHGGNRAV